MAHPHIFIDTRYEVILNDRNEATALRIGWTYDDLYALLIFGDLSLDPDGDGMLTPEESAMNRAFVDAAQSVNVLVDSSKFKAQAIFRIGVSSFSVQ